MGGSWRRWAVAVSRRGPVCGQASCIASLARGAQAVQALLRHLEDAGFAGAPRVVGGGFAPDGREMVSYIEGSSPHPHAWAEDAVGGIGALLAGWRSGRRTGMNELDDLAARLRDAGGLPDLLAVAHAAFGAIVLSSADVIGEPVRGMLVPRR